MFKNLDVANKIHVPIILSIVIGLVIVIGTSINSISNIKSNVLEEQKSSMSYITGLKWQAKLSISLTNSIKFGS
jgi:methyl-accepting chemotaxis protein